MDNCLECGCSMVRDYKCRHDCDMCQGCDPFDCEQCEDSGFITKIEWAEVDGRDMDYEKTIKCDCQDD